MFTLIMGLKHYVFYNRMTLLYRGNASNSVNRYKKCMCIKILAEISVYSI